MPKKSLVKTEKPVQYEVQKVLGAKFTSKCPSIRKTASEYKIRWVGFSAKWDTWEPADGMEASATESIDSYWEEREIAAKLKQDSKVVKTEVVVENTRPRRSTATKKTTEAGVARITEKLESTTIQKRGNKRGSLYNNDAKSPNSKKVKTALEQVEDRVLESMIDTKKRSTRRAKSENIGLEKSEDGKLATVIPKKVALKKTSSKGSSSKRVAENKALAEKLSKKQAEKIKTPGTKKITKTKTGLPIAFQKKSAVKKTKTEAPARKSVSKSKNKKPSTESEINKLKKSQILKVVKHVLKEESYAILESVKQHVDQQMDRFQRSQEDFYTEIKTLILSCESELSDELSKEIVQVVGPKGPVGVKTAKNNSDDDSTERKDSETIAASIVPVEVGIDSSAMEDKTKTANEENIDPSKMTKTEQMAFLKSQAVLVEKRKSGDEKVLA